MQLPEDRPYTIFAEVMDRRGFAGGTRALGAAAVRDRILAAETQP